MPPNEGRRSEETGAQMARGRLTSRVDNGLGELVATYAFRTPDGHEWFQKLRYRTNDSRGKTFRYRWRKGPGYVWNWGKRERADELLYHLPDLLAAKADGDPIIWCEGEKDADATIEATGLLATSHHGGALKITRQQAMWFRGHRGLVYLAYDLDPDDPLTGGNPGAADVVKRYDLLLSIG